MRRRVAALVLTLVLAEAELELVPENIVLHPQVQRAARHKDRRPSRTLLDSSLHHEALRQVPEGERRGRPDLVHFAMLLGLDSALNQADELRIVVHTRNDERLAIHPDTRLMRNYPRFVGLMEKLFQEGASPKENPLLVLEPGWPLARILEHHKSGPIVAFHEKGAPVEPGAYLAAKREASPDLTVVLGAFPHGDFHAPAETWANEVVGLGGNALSVWTVEMEILAHWERACKVFPRAVAPSPQAAPTPE
ncbi:MAG: rRNA small subunit pseudouridine methyltransferase Nep1 [Thermoplasmata archaeon]|nr:rRNA small subunit pseudouridine methyltransferase Nep1 [Thermoplasmata archaeon]